MRLFRLILSILLFSGTVYVLNNPISLKTATIPPLGDFLNPFKGYLQNGEAPIKEWEQSLSIEGLIDPVSIVWDSVGIPHIFAKNDNDLFMAQGYIEARERLWQMEFQILAASGRISEVIGSKALDFDRLQRRKDFLTGARASLEEVKKNPEVYRQLEQYSKGVNTYIQSLDYSTLPLEYKLLDYYPEEWTPLKSSMLIVYMIDQLIGSDKDIENTNALAYLGRETYELLYPESTPGIDPVVPTFQPWSFEPLSTTPDSIQFSIYDFTKIRESNPDNGSNNWVVSGKKAKNGIPILANDTHLGLNLPSLWIITHLKSPSLNTAGFSLVGGPGVVIGFNEKVAWGFTNAPRDQRDWYRITYNPDNPEEYLYKDNYVPVKYKYDTIKIKGEPFFIDTIKITEAGPVIYDDRFPGKGSRKDLAFKWIGHYPSGVYQAINLFNRAGTHDDFKKGLEYWDSPSQNIVFASTDGDIALHIEGTFPLKWKEQGKFIMDAAREKHLWNEFIPHEQNAYLLNPDRGFVSSANQHSVDDQYPYYVYSSTNEAYRNRRINNLLSKNDSIEVKDFMGMQYDSYSLLAEEVLPFFYDSLEIQGFDSIHFAHYYRVGDWDFRYSPDSHAASLFDAWWKSFKEILWDELKVEGLKLPIPNDFHTAYLIKNNNDLPFYDILGTEYKETLKIVINISFTRAIEQVLEWEKELGSSEWAVVNNVRLMHLTKLPALSSKILPVPGCGDAVNAANGNHGPSQRLIVEMTSPPSALVALPGGISGNPGSPRYMGFVDKYILGHYVPLLLPEVPSDLQNSFTQTLISK